MKTVRTRIAVVLLAITVQIATAAPILARANDREVVDPIIKRIVKVVKTITGIAIRTLEDYPSNPKP